VSQKERDDLTRAVEAGLDAVGPKTESILPVVLPGVLTRIAIDLNRIADALEQQVAQTPVPGTR
jgi:hypothetical protein